MQRPTARLRAASKTAVFVKADHVTLLERLLALAPRVPLAEVTGGARELDPVPAERNVASLGASVVLERHELLAASFQLDVHDRPRIPNLRLVGDQRDRGQGRATHRELQVFYQSCEAGFISTRVSECESWFKMLRSLRALPVAPQAKALAFGRMAAEVQGKAVSLSLTVQDASDAKHLMVIALDIDIGGR